MAAMDKTEAFFEIVNAIRNGSSFEHLIPCLIHHFPRNSEVSADSTEIASGHMVVSLRAGFFASGR